MNSRRFPKSEGKVFFTSGHFSMCGRFSRWELINQSELNVSHTHILNEEKLLYIVSQFYSLFCALA